MRDRWMVSYMDVLTILLVFFVAVAAKSLAMKAPEPAPVVPPRPAALEAVRRQLIEQGMDARTSLRVEERGLVISLPQALLFHAGKDRIDPEALPVVSQIAVVLRRIPNRISIVGHADATPIHNRRFRSNWELASARGLQLLNVLEMRFEIAEARLSTASYGSVDPQSPNDTAAGRAQNRRVEIVVLDEKP